MSSAGARDSPQNIIKSVECSRRDTARRVALGPLSRLVCRVPAAAYGQHRENLVALGCYQSRTHGATVMGRRRPCSRVSALPVKKSSAQEVGPLDFAWLHHGTGFLNLDPVVAF